MNVVSDEVRPWRLAAFVGGVALPSIEALAKWPGVKEGALGFRAGTEDPRVTSFVGLLACVDTLVLLSKLKTSLVSELGVFEPDDELELSLM